MAAQLARFYDLPCRTGGSLTDAGVPDAQALAEGALTLSTAVRSGANFILHACGMIGSYIGNSFEFATDKHRQRRTKADYWSGDAPDQLRSPLRGKNNLTNRIDPGNAYSIILSILAFGLITFFFFY